jgi:hypothetical protein
MPTIFVLTIITVILWPNSKVDTFINTSNHTSMEKCITARTYVEKDRGHPPDKAFRVKHVGNCVAVIN